MPRMARAKHLTDLQLAVMRVLWAQGETTVAQAQEALRSTRDLATTTVATVLARLERQGLVAHRVAGRQYRYRALVSEGDVRRSMVAEVVERLFHGDSTALVSHLLQESEIAPDDLARVQTMIEAHRRREGDKGERPEPGG
jgi:BlaI family transcriptional regulator, penicillinase repressor